jgi:DNA polymerase
LEQAQLKRGDVYIANILKCRPPNNRDPLAEEVEQCTPYLQRQIEMIKPKLLVALGRVAAQNLLNTQSSLSSMRNQIWSYRDIPLMVTYHPAYILRNNNMLDSAVEDMRRAVEYYQKNTS